MMRQTIIAESMVGKVAYLMWLGKRGVDRGRERQREAGVPLSPLRKHPL
jgi:hypothetical protein